MRVRRMHSTLLFLLKLFFMANYWFLNSCYFLPFMLNKHLRQCVDAYYIHYHKYSGLFVYEFIIDYRL